MDSKAKSRAYARRQNILFAEEISRAQWEFLKRLALADRQQLAISGRTFAMCQRLRDKGLVKITTVGLSRKMGGFVAMSDKGSALVMRELLAQIPKEM